MYSKIDLHIHSEFSDGTDSVEGIVSKIVEQGIEFFSLTDHDEIQGSKLVSDMVSHPDFLSGIEFSCKTNGDKYHILGYGYDLNADAITKTIEMTHKARIDKIYKIEALLKKDFNMTFAHEEIEELLSHNSPGKPHVANLMVRKGYASDITSAFSILNTLHTGSSYLTTEEAIDVILKSGGVPVLAHGILGDGKLNLSESEIASRVSRLRSEGLMGLECYYSTYTREQHEIMRNLAHRENMLITAGSDYHGKNKAINLGDIGLVTTNNDDISQFFDAVSDKILRKCN